MKDGFVEKKGMRRMKAILIALVIAGLAVGGILVGCVYAKSRLTRPVEASDCIIVLGARVWMDGKPSDSLIYRIDSAIAAYEEGLAENIIVCGAQGSNEPATEASVMRKMLLDAGIPGDVIFMDEASYNTEQNLTNAKAIMDANGFESAIVISSDYHVERALWLARDAGIETAWGVHAASPRPFFTIWRLRMREAASWVVYCLRKLF